MLNVSGQTTILGVLMTIHAPTKEQVDNIPVYLSSPYLDEVNNLKEVIQNAQRTDTKPDISSFHDLAVNAVDPKLLPKNKQEEPVKSVESKPVKRTAKKSAVKRTAKK